MAHFYMETGGGQVHIYCREQETYEKIFVNAHDDGPLTQIRPGREEGVPQALTRHHLFVNGNRVYAVKLDATNHDGEGMNLPPEIASAVLAVFPGWEIGPERFIPSAPFAAGMLTVLTDF